MHKSSMATSKLLCVAGMKIESESPDIYIDFSLDNMVYHLHSDIITPILK
jgi:hypothetical protein